MPFIDAIDTYLRYVRMRLAVINPNRVVKGPIDAQDWPLDKVEAGALYLLVLDDSPIGQQGYSAAIPIYHHVIQWSWAVFGNDLGECAIGNNRGNRYRLDNQIKGELIKATYPGFTDKVSLSVTPGQLVATPYDPAEPIWWTPLEFGPKRTDKDSGVVYGIGTTYITQMTDLITA